MFVTWNDHSKDIPEGSHAILGASQGAWLNYTDEKLRNYYNNLKAKELGTHLHAMAKELIDMKIRLPRSKKTLNQYVNDAIGFGMSTEVPLKYSPRCYGTADSICFRKHILRIHDLKTGRNEITHFRQLEIYAALFFLEYDMVPEDTALMELRIYQNDNVKTEHPTNDVIHSIMDRLVYCDNYIREMEEGNNVLP